MIKSKTADIGEQLEAITVSEADLSQVADGIYNGSHSVFPVSVEVSVTVREHVQCYFESHRKRTDRLTVIISSSDYKKSYMEV